MLLNLHRDCDRGMSGMTYPDGGSVLDQPVLLLQAFAIIADAKAKMRKASAG